jgi:hypothetical protein
MIQWHPAATVHTARIGIGTRKLDKRQSDTEYGLFITYLHGSPSLPTLT